jgi:hypothetical protein
MSQVTAESDGAAGHGGVRESTRSVVERVQAVIGRERVGFALIAGGTIAVFLSWPLQSKSLRALGGVAALAGTAASVRGRLAARRERIDVAESQAQAALDGLDPIARAQVLADLATS